MEYTQLISRILDAEKSAQNIAKTVEIRQEKIPDEIAQEAASLRTAKQNEAETRIHDFALETAKMRDAAMQEQEKCRADSMAHMERAYERYGDNWVNTMFLLIVGENA